MIAEFKTSKFDGLGILVPDDADFTCGFSIPNTGSFLFYSIINGDLKNIKLPPGQYKIIGIQTEITEEQARIISDVKKKYVPGGFGIYFKNYITKKYDCDTALESFNSLMQKLEIKPDTKTLIIQKIKQS